MFKAWTTCKSVPDQKKLAWNDTTSFLVCASFHSNYIPNQQEAQNEDRNSEIISSASGEVVRCNEVYFKYIPKGQ